MEKFKIFTATKMFGSQFATGYFKTRKDASGWLHIEEFDATSIAESARIDNIDDLLRMLNAHWKS